MARAMGFLIVLVVVSFMMATSTEGLSICNIDANEYFVCLPAIHGSSPSPPTSGCCSAIKSADLNCLCSYKDSGILPSFGIDPKLAMELPRKCNLVAPPGCQEGISSPVSTPEPSP